MKEKKFFFGTRKSDGAKIYLSAPTWDCGWYWSFGYLGNYREHYHLSNYQAKDHYFKLADGSIKLVREKRNICMRDALLEDYKLNPVLASNLWVFCELALTAYALKETAEVLNRGGSHMTKNPCDKIIQNKEEVDRINKIVLPAIFAEIEKLFS